MTLDALPDRRLIYRQIFQIVYLFRYSEIRVLLEQLQRRCVELGQVPHAYPQVCLVQSTLQLFVTVLHYILQHDNRKQRYVPEAGRVTFGNDAVLDVEVLLYHIVQCYLALNRVRIQQLLFPRDFDEKRDVMYVIVRFVHDLY